MIKKFIEKLLGKTQTNAPSASQAGEGQDRLGQADASASPKRQRSKLSLAKSKSKAAASLGKRVDIKAKQHGIDANWVSDDAFHVVQTLQQAGFEAYIVGGAVRDLMVGLRPKDFDVATNATPEQVKPLFRRAFLIGRRFRIVHVVFGRGREHEVIEVTTFRANVDNASATQVRGNERTSKADLAGVSHAVDASGRVLRDNVWGSLQEDAARRDFTINAMYYDPVANIVVDFHDGAKDIAKKRIRMIGDVATRYREDPVRIIRAVRFAAKLASSGFALDADTAKPLQQALPLLKDVPQSRLFDEMLKLLQTGHAKASIDALHCYHLDKGIYPLLDVVVARANEPLVASVLADTDRRVQEDKGVAPSFLLACVLWSDVRDLWAANQQRGLPPFPALHEAMDAVFDQRIGDVSGRGKLAADMREIWAMQPRFEKRVGKSPYTLAEHARFRAGFDFLRLRAQTGEVPESLSLWWEQFSTADSDADREHLIRAAKAEKSDKSTSSSSQAANHSSTNHPSTHNPNPTKPKRRRRRPSSAKSSDPKSSDPKSSDPAAS